jgi:DNA modification methylase
MIYHGDCLDILKTLDENSVDALVTDPPASISFMGKKWDTFSDKAKFLLEMTCIYQQVFRIMKPGSHGLVWGLPRTSHLTATALENAGFEIRDIINHLFGSGFPKSLNLGNGFGTGLKPACEHWILVRKPISEKTIAANVLKWGCGGLNIGASRIAVNANDPNSRPNGSIPFYKGGNGSMFKIGGRNYDTCDGNTLNLKKGRFPANLILDEEAGAMLDAQSGNLKSGKISGVADKMRYHGAKGYEEKRNASQRGASRFFKCFARDTNESCQSQRDLENVVIVEVNSKSIKVQIVSVLEAVLKKEGQEDKPLSDSIQHFIQETLKQLNSNAEIDLPMIQNIASKYWQELKLIEKSYKDRASYVEMLKLTDTMKIIQNLSMSTSTVENATLNTTLKNSDRGEKVLGSRFIYCPKASKKDRNAGCKQSNAHPTVKSTTLMSYLINLITPPGRTVLDPFLGSGSTGVAAIQNNFQFIGIEKELEYFEIAKCRIEWAEKNKHE